MRKQRCGNPDLNADHSGYRGWGGRPDMVRLYIRTSEKVTEDQDGKPIAYYEQKTKRTWEPVGQMCPWCRWILIDDLPEGEDLG